MTNQEAINKLIIARNVYDGMGESYKPWVEVIDMAISALQEQELSNNSPKLDSEFGDLISRQDAIDALKNRWKKTRNYEGNGDDIAEECELYLKQVPPAQPEHDENDLDFVQTHKRIPVQLVVSSDCISRADVEQTIEDNILCYTHSDRPIDQDADTECHMAIRVALKMLRKDLRKLPSSQPDIIHCGECRHFATKGNIERVEFGTCLVTKGVCLREDYCSWAERKEGEADG